MKKYDLLAITISTVCFLIAFLTTDNIIIGAGVFVVYLAYYFLILRKKFANYIDNNKRLHTCYNFINSFLVTLSVKESFEEAFVSGTRNADKKFSEFLLEMEEMTIDQKIEYLTRYFHFGIYHMFTNVVKLYQEQGGNILKMADSLMSESRRIEETVVECESISVKKGIEFLVLWGLSFIVLLFMRFALSNFYMNMLKSKIFLILLIVFFLVVLLSLHLMASKYVILPVKEESVQYE